MKTTFESGDRVKTKVLGGKGDKPDVWVTATVIGVNGDSESYNLAVDKQWHDQFAPEALRVPADLIEGMEPVEQKSLISMIVFPNAVAAGVTNSKSPTRSPASSPKGKDLKYDVGTLVETRIVYGRKDSQAWIEAEIVKYNGDDDSWDLKVLKPKLHNVMKNAVHVPDIHVREVLEVVNFPEPPVDDYMMPLTEVNPKDVETVVNKGHPPKLARLALQMSLGDLNFAENLLAATQQPGRESDIRRGGVMHINIISAESQKPISCVYMKLDGDVQVTDVVKQTNKAEFKSLMSWADYSPSPTLEIELWQHNRFRSNKCVGRKQVENFGEFIKKSIDNARTLKVDIMDKHKVVGNVEMKVLVQRTGLARVEI